VSARNDFLADLTLLISRETFDREQLLCAIVRMTRCRPQHKADLPLRRSIAAEPSGRFRYVILRNDGTVAQASSATFSTEAAARAEGGPVLRRRSLAAKLTTLNRKRA
jgi:hypothetical protein